MFYDYDIYDDDIEAKAIQPPPQNNTNLSNVFMVVIGSLIGWYAGRLVSKKEWVSIATGVAGGVLLPQFIKQTQASTAILPWQEHIKYNSIKTELAPTVEV